MNPSTRRLNGMMVLVAVVMVSTGCSTFRAGPERAQRSMRYQGVADGYATASEIRKYDGDILQMDLWSNSQQSGEILNLDIWPVVGIGIGLFGLRAHVGGLGAGFGFMFYHPESTRTAGDIVEVD